MYSAAESQSSAVLPSVGFTFIPHGEVTSPRGFKAAGIHGGFRDDPSRLDFALVAADEPCACAAVFTQNVFCAAPVRVSREKLEAEEGPGNSFGTARAVMINSGNANAATGEAGLQVARTSAEIMAEALGCANDEVLVASTGLIGAQLGLGLFQNASPIIVRELSPEGGHNAARAIMTTDTHPKEGALCFSGDAFGYEGSTFTIGAMTKGSGMIMPDMATMIAVITTDAPLLPSDLHEALKQAAALSFNRVTVDSDTSTNDSCFIFANGEAAGLQAQPFARDSIAFRVFVEALTLLCVKLARAMAADGEGASRLITVNVRGAASSVDADKAARAVANSPLVKTAVAGHDANWGRIAMALGKSGAVFCQEYVDINVMGLPVCRQGLDVSFDESEALRRFENSEIVIDVDLGSGAASATIWTCDLTHEYITINGDYRS